MADPRFELADVVAPAAPAMVAGASGLVGWAWSAGVLELLGLALAVWWWLRGRSKRRLRAIRSAALLQRDDVLTLSAQLDAWARAHYQLNWLNPAHPPSGIDLIAWVDWLDALSALRFAPPSSDGFDRVVGVCDTAQTWIHHA